MNSYIFLQAVLFTATQTAPLAVPMPGYHCGPSTNLCNPFSGNPESVGTESQPSNFRSSTSNANPVNDALIGAQISPDESYPISSQKTSPKSPKTSTSHRADSGSLDPAPLSLFPTCDIYHQCNICDYSDLRQVECEPADMFFDGGDLEKPYYKLCTRIPDSDGPGQCYWWEGELMEKRVKREGVYL